MNVSTVSTAQRTNFPLLFYCFLFPRFFSPSTRAACPQKALYEEKMSDDDDYRPKSPDLDFGSYSPATAPAPAPHHDEFQIPHQSPSQSHQSQYHMQSQPSPQAQQSPPAPLRVNPPQNWYQSNQGGHSRSYSYSASATGQSPTVSGFYAYQPLSATATTPTYNSPRFPSHQQHLPQQYQNPQEYQHRGYMGQEQEPYLPTGFSPSAPGYPQPTYQSPFSASAYSPQPPHDPSYVQPAVPHSQQSPTKQEDDLSIQVKTEESESSTMPPRRAAAAAAAAEADAMEPSPVKTKFPTARIKRIMQADEEVGKVAQQTPIAVGKALEMFMIQLVTKSAEVARDKNSKRVTPAMLKTVVETDEHWDFLREIVSKVEQDKEGAGGGKGKAAAKAESDSEDEESDVPKKKRGGGRRKKPS